MKIYSHGYGCKDLSSFGGAKDGKTEADVGFVGIVERKYYSKIEWGLVEKGGGDWIYPRPCSKVFSRT